MSTGAAASDTCQTPCNMNRLVALSPTSCALGTCRTPGGIANPATTLGMAWMRGTQHMLLHNKTCQCCTVAQSSESETIRKLDSTSEARYVQDHELHVACPELPLPPPPHCQSITLSLPSQFSDPDPSFAQDANRKSNLLLPLSFVLAR